MSFLTQVDELISIAMRQEAGGYDDGRELAAALAACDTNAFKHFPPDLVSLLEREGVIANAGHAEHQASDAGQPIEAEEVATRFDLPRPVLEAAVAAQLSLYAFWYQRGAGRIHERARQALAQKYSAAPVVDVALSERLATDAPPRSCFWSAAKALHRLPRLRTAPGPATVPASEDRRPPATAGATRDALIPRGTRTFERDDLPPPDAHPRR